MNEENIKRIEKKVNLLYKILLEKSYDKDYSYNQKYINGFMNELIPLFELSAEKEKIKPEIPTPEEIKKLLKDYISESEQLKKDYEKGDYLAKEKNEIITRIGDLKENIKELADIFHTHKRIEDIHQEIYETHLHWDLRKKLGLIKEQDYDSFSLIFSNLWRDLRGLLRNVRVVGRKKTEKEIIEDELAEEEECFMEEFENETGKSAITPRNIVRKEYLEWKKNLNNEIE
ncbi:hypothetical protein LCGC14_0659990 [marine sediment metagenome]|uniref:Uncharacterized protein n=1 Tax=marine sediment metagenome TaxID=412755 RepID=A0A0F9QTU5_9ZZZZ